MLAGSTSDALPGVHVSRNPASRALPSRSWSADRCVCAYPHAGGTVRINLVCYNTFSFSTSAQALEAPSIDIKKSGDDSSKTQIPGVQMSSRTRNNVVLEVNSILPLPESLEPSEW